MSKLDLPLDLVVNNDSKGNRQQTNRGKRKRGDELLEAGWLEQAFQFLHFGGIGYSCTIPVLAGGGDCTQGL